MAIHVVNEARRCLHCKKPMCREGCPINTNIPEVIELFRTGHKEDAGAMLYENNPLSVICSLVCDHDKQCEGIAFWDARARRFIFPVSRIISRIPILTICIWKCSLRPASESPSSAAVLPVSPSAFCWHSAAIR